MLGNYQEKIYYRSPLCRHFSPKDPIISQASDLHHHFELRFARVDYEPIANPSLLAGKFTVEEDYMLSQLIDVQTQVLAIENNVTELLKGKQCALLFETISPHCAAACKI